MSRKKIIKSIIILCIVALVTPFITGASNRPARQMDGSGGRQIVLIMRDSDLKFVSVIIQGFNQNRKESTWKKQDNKGFSVAYTKDWWWIEDFVKISMVVEDRRNGRSFSDTCTFDALEQPKDSPRVEILYDRNAKCIGGEAGSARDPLYKAVLPVRDALKTIDYYLSDYDINTLIEFIYIEMNASSCFVGVATALATYGTSYLAAKPTIDKTCAKTSEIILKKFFLKP